MTTPSTPPNTGEIALPDDVLDMDRDDAPSRLVGIGASAGGLEALVKFFTVLPVNTGMAFVVIQHLSPDYKSVMDELLERFNGMPVITVTDRTQVKANCIYIITPGRELEAQGNDLVSRERNKEGVLFLPINRFFRSLAKVWGENSVGIVLSGTGSDGSHGVLDIRDAGGIVLVESLGSARFTGMPQSAIATGCVDAVLTPEEMPAALQAYLADPSSLSVDSSGASKTGNHSDSSLDDILDLLRRKFRADFNQYKPATIKRRIERRVTLYNMSLRAYRELLESNPEALSQLYRDLLIGVTRFFRDAESFDVLKRKVIPDLLSQVDEDDELRVWDCGCATGEEAYSVAMLFLDAIEKSGRPRNFKLLATDLNQESIYKASAGVYPADSLSEAPRELILRYFDVVDESTYRVKPELRRSMVFSQHNLISDPPFTKMHLVVCRNLLIYLKPDVQNMAMSSFHYSLQMGGCLFLGSSETLGEIENQFETIDRFWKIYKKISNERLQLSFKTDTLDHSRHPAMGLRRNASPLMKFYDKLLDTYVPSGFLINDDMDVMHVFGDAKRFLRQQTGPASTSIADFVVHDLQLPIASAIRTVQRKGAAMTLPGVSVKLNDEIEGMRIKVVPVGDEGRKQTFMVELQPGTEQTRNRADDPHRDALGDDKSQMLRMDEEVRNYVRDLETELARTRESLQATVEELEASNEELQASNEELLASNEELQSTNEELHSVNEELYSVNAEHELKIDELHQSTTDLRNLMNSTNTITLFVGQDFKLRLFTPRAFEVISIMPQDIGRDIRHFKSNINDSLLTEDIGNIIRAGNPITRFLPQSGGKSFLRTCSSYQDSAGKMCGVVINYQDTTTVTRTQMALEKSETKYETILAAAPLPILVINQSNEVASANHAAEKAFDAGTSGLTAMDVNKLFAFDSAAHAVTTDQPQIPTKVTARTVNGKVFEADLVVGQMALGAENYWMVFMTNLTPANA